MQYELFVNKNSQEIEDEIIDKKENEHLSPKQIIYRNYLKSVTWKHIRQEALEYYNYTCQKCGHVGRDVHHVNYPEEWGQETIHDLLVLCRACHDLEHSPVEEPKSSSPKMERIHVRAISSFLSEENTKELQKEYPNQDLHTLFISDTKEGEEARKKAIKLLNIQEFFKHGGKKYSYAYGLNDFVKVEEPNMLTAKESRLLHEKKLAKQKKNSIKQIRMIKNYYKNAPRHLRDNKF